MDEITKISKINIYTCCFLAVVCFSLSIGAFYFESIMLQKEIPIRPTQPEVAYAVSNLKGEELEKFINRGIELNRNIAESSTNLLTSSIGMVYPIFFVFGVFLFGFAYSFYKIKKRSSEQAH